MTEDKAKIFLSSSSDLAASRKHIAEAISVWLEKIGHGDDLDSYLWEEATENGDLLSHREPIQPQLLDPLDWNTTFTICLFGERCGIPFEEDIPEAWLERLKPWRATDKLPGLRHPWPLEDRETQAKLLRRGDFPLTGTVFELISACAAPKDQNDLIVCYSSSVRINSGTTPKDTIFNDQKERKRLLVGTTSERQQEEIIRAQYNPQTHALLNVLKYFIAHKNGSAKRCGSEYELRKETIRLARKKLNKIYNLETDSNPFKLSLDHWKIDDPKLPGREDLINKEILPLLLNSNEGETSPLVLVTGPSGCGKSSVLQRGVLGALEKKGMVVLPIRPTELERVGEKDRLDVFWDMLCDRITGCHIPGIRPLKRDQTMSQRLLEVLEYQNIELAIGIDQFEEMLDEMAQFSSNNHRTRGWWLLLRFFKQIAVSQRVHLVATLESSRRDTFTKLEIESVVGLPFRTCSADVTAKEIKNIAEKGFTSGGLRLHGSLLQEIQDKWDAFQQKRATTIVAASPLPLACLWFAQLYEANEDRAQKTDREDGGSTLGQKMANVTTEQTALTLEDIGGSDAVSFEGVIDRLASEAWTEALGEKPPEGRVIENPEAYLGLIAFFDPLVAFDKSNHLRLLSAPSNAGHKYTERFYISFIKHRLLVPAGRPDRVRLVHQAVINQWSPAQEWLEWRQAYLETECSLLEAAKVWVFAGRKKVRKNADLIQQAAQVLLVNRAEWKSATPDSLSDGNGSLRDYCLALIGKATNGLEPIQISLSGTRVISVTAMYQLKPILQKLLRATPEALFLESKYEDTLLNWAATVDGPATEVLIDSAYEAGKREWLKKPSTSGWHPIATAIQEHANENFRLLINEYDDWNVIVASGERTMLHIAAMVDNLVAASHLAQSPGINFNHKNSGGNSPIDTASLHGSENVFRFLVEKDQQFVEEGSYNPLHRAAINNKVDIIKAALSSPYLDEEIKEKALVHKPRPLSGTPLMEAARGRAPETLAELLEYCEPNDEVHRELSGRTLLHLALSVTGDSKLSINEQNRATQCVKILLEDDRVDVMALADGKTALEIGAEDDQFKSARRVLRQYMPLDYGKMSPALKQADLLSNNSKDYRRLLEHAPQVLSDKLGNITGLDLLIDEKRTRVLTAILQEGIAPTSLLRRRWSKLITLASEPNEAALRRALLEYIPMKSKADLSPLLDAAIRDADRRENDLISSLFARGVRLPYGTNAINRSTFHDLAIVGEIERFEILVKSHNFKLPIDSWGRAPSELASTVNQGAFKELEARYFEGRHTPNRATADWSPYLALEREDGVQLTGPARRKVLAILRKIDDLPAFKAKQTTTTSFSLPFYKNSHLIEVTNPDWDQGLMRICFLLREDLLTRLAGTSPPIHEFNAQLKTRIPRTSSREYLAFFCFFVRGEDGPFLVVDRVDNKFIPESARTPEFGDAMRPVRLWGRNETGEWRASACIYYADALFHADFLIHPDGMVEMVHDIPIISELGATIYAPLMP